MRLTTENRPVETKARFIISVDNRDSVRALEHSVTLTANAPDGTDALGPDLSNRVSEIAQRILSDSPDLFMCTAIKRYPEP